GDDLEYEEFRVERNAVVTQTIGKGFSRQSMTGRMANGTPLNAERIDDAKKLQNKIAVYVNHLPHKSILLIANKTVESTLQPLLKKHIRTDHFNAVRGINAYEDNEAAIGIGREQPSWSTVENIARAFSASDAEPFLSIADIVSDPSSDYFKATRGIRRSDGKV